MTALGLVEGVRRELYRDDAFKVSVYPYVQILLLYSIPSFIISNYMFKCNRRKFKSTQVSSVKKAKANNCPVWLKCRQAPWIAYSIM